MTGEEIRKYRKDLGISLRDLGKLSGVFFTKIHYIEHGLKPREDEAHRLAWALAEADARKDEANDD